MQVQKTSERLGEYVVTLMGTGMTILQPLMGTALTETLEGTDQSHSPIHGGKFDVALKAICSDFSEFELVFNWSCLFLTDSFSLQVLVDEVHTKQRCGKDKGVIIPLWDPVQEGAFVISYNDQTFC